MAERPRIPINPEEYLKKRYEVSKEILASTLSDGKVESMMELKKRESLIFNCVELADMLLVELGYYSSQKSENTSIHNLKEILASAKVQNDD